MTETNGAPPTPPQKVIVAFEFDMATGQIAQSIPQGVPFGALALMALMLERIVTLSMEAAAPPPAPRLAVVRAMPDNLPGPQ